MRGAPDIISSGRRRAAGLCVLGFLAAQTFQELCYRLWVPEPIEPAAQLAVYLLPLDRARAIAVEAGILLLTVPFVVVALRYFDRRPIASIVGLLAGASFVLLETIHRSLDFVMAGGWAAAFRKAVGPERAAILSRFAAWNEFSRAFYLPLLLSFFVASCCFAIAIWRERARRRRDWLGAAGYGLNAVRLLGRLSSNFAGQEWLAGFNDQLYFPAVVIINALIAAWFFSTAEDGAGQERG